MRPGGRAYITVLDKHTADLIMNQGHDIAPVLREFDKYVNFKKADYDILSIFPGSPASQVFYDINYLCKRWGRMLKIVSITQEAYWQQTAVLLEKEPVADR